MGRKPRLLSRAKFYPEAQPSIAVTTHTFSDKSLSGSDRLITARQSFKTEQQTLKIGDFLSHENVKLSVKASKTIKKLSKENLAVHDKRLEARPSTGMSALKASSSPLTSSWESFSAPKELLTRREEVSQPAADQILEENSFRQAEFNPQLPPTAEHPEPAVHYDTLLKSLGLKQRKQVQNCLSLLYSTLFLLCSFSCAENTKVCVSPWATRLINDTSFTNQPLLSFHQISIL